MMVSITIDGKRLEVERGATILEAAEKFGISIPTLCYLRELEPFTSCMICVVEEQQSERLLPACSTPVSEGMDVITSNDRINKARKDTLDLLVSEHVGSCEAPCVRACAAYMNIPLMIDHIRKKDLDSAIRVVKNNIALPAILGRICPAPCEKICTRKHMDESISICLLKRYVADMDLQKPSPYVPELQPVSGKTVAIVGAGPAGLAAAYYLRCAGHQSILHDLHELPGGELRYAIPQDRLSRKILDMELETVLLPGITFRKNSRLGKDYSVKELREQYDAVVLTLGVIEQDASYLSDLRMASKGIDINRRTYETSIPGVFSGGNSVTTGKLAIRSLAHGKFMSVSIDQYLREEPVTGHPRRFNSVIGRMSEVEARELGQLSSADQRYATDSAVQGFSDEQAMGESLRCLRCDCRKAVSCKLRIYSTEYEVQQQRFKTGIRKQLRLLTDHDLIVFEPGKCIKCGLCVQITARSEGSLGLSFTGRGYDTTIEVPFNALLRDGLQQTALECVEACPTAALALKHSFEEVEDVTR